MTDQTAAVGIQNTTPSAPKVTVRKPSPFLNIFVNIIFPSLILHKLSTPDRLGPVAALLLALSLPTLYGAWEFFTAKHHNFISMLGFVSILLNGGLGLLQVDGFWFAVKDSSIPALIGLATLGSLKTKSPFVRLMLYNENVINIAAVDAALDERKAHAGFESLMMRTTLILASSFMLSAVLNFFLARYLLTGQAGTPEFNAQLGKMTAMSFPVIVLPCIIVMMFAVWMLVRGLRGLTGLEMDHILADGKAAKS